MVQKCVGLIINLLRNDCVSMIYEESGKLYYFCSDIPYLKENKDKKYFSSWANYPNSRVVQSVFNGLINYSFISNV